MISSSKRVIKRPDTDWAVEQYTLPLEVSFSSPDTAARKAVFPHYTRDGRRVGEEDTDSDSSEPESGEGEAESQPDPDVILREQWNEEARQALEDARKEAEEILTRAREEAEREHARAKEEGFREGFESGYREGSDQAKAECQEAFDARMEEIRKDIEDALHSVDIAKEKCVRMYLDELKDCAIAIGEKVIHISLRSSGEVIKQMIISATEKLKKTAWVKIYINKCDYDLMMEADADILDELSHLSDNIKFIVMDKEERGSCIIEMPEEIVDVSVNTQIENIKDILENVRI